MESEDSILWVSLKGDVERLGRSANEKHFQTRNEKKGWLTKRGGRIKNWKRRWFVLADNCLYYYKGPEVRT